MASLGKVVSAKSRNKGLYFGGRKSDKFVRCYEKDELEVFRVELELHSSFLRSHQITTLGRLNALTSAIYPSHIRFVSVDWTKLERYLAKAKGSQGLSILDEARERAASIHRLCSYLRQHDVNNPHRFLTPMRLNKRIVAALHRWDREFTPEAVWIKAI